MKEVRVLEIKERQDGEKSGIAKFHMTECSLSEFFTQDRRNLKTICHRNIRNLCERISDALQISGFYIFYCLFPNGKSGAKAYLVNTGWNGTGKRISIKDTRGIIDAILNGDIKTAPTKTIPYFNFEVPTELPGVDSGILDPRDTYADAAQWEEKAKDLADRFIKNFAKYEGNEAGKALVAAGPQK